VIDVFAGAGIADAHVVKAGLSSCSTLQTLARLTNPSHRPLQPASESAPPPPIRPLLELV
ncbi:hypothetical protein PIB30_101278, partial [Stylosanthes scabra]|nr:hypothetical protein [Stylosanthes scabra]